MAEAERTPGEFDLIAAIRRQIRADARVPVGIGDDCAVLRPAAGADLIVTKDMLLEGRHFRRPDATSAEIGFKALAVNLSDVAAMAGRPIAAFVAVALPRADALPLAEGLIAGMRPLAERFGVALAGGDTNAWDGPLVISVTVVGAAHPKGPVLRSGARPGDVVCVTGPLGGSLLGRHLRPEPRIVEARRLHDQFDLHAMIDLSDGLSSDLGHILEESGDLGAVLDEAAIPIHPDAQILAARDGSAAMGHALDDGEDFELCFTLAESEAARLGMTPGFSELIHRIGTITREPGLRLRRRDGTIDDVAARGFDHFRDDRDRTLP